MRGGGLFEVSNELRGFRAVCRPSPKTRVRSTPQAALILQKRADDAELWGFALKPRVVGPWVEKAEMLAPGDPVGPIPTLENSGNGSLRQPIGRREHTKSIAVEASQSFA